MEFRNFRPLRPGQMPTRQQWNRLSAGAERDGRLEAGKSGSDARRSRGIIALFELTEPAQMPDIERTGGDATEPDVPWADNCMLVVLYPWDADASTGNQYGAQDKDLSCYQPYTLYWPATERNDDGIAIGDAPAVTGDRVYATFNHQSGRWEVIPTASTSGAILIRFQILGAAPFQAEGAGECAAVRASVVGVSCNSAGVSVGDEVTIWDPTACWFNLAMDVLTGMYGMATKMSTTGDDLVALCNAGTGTGSEPAGSCYWTVLNLCCTEEVADT